MHLRARIVLFLILGLTAAAGVYAQNGAPRAGAVVTDMRGTLTVQTGGYPPQAFKAGVAIPVGAILRTGAKSDAMLVFPDGMICSLGANSTFRIANYAYFPLDSAKSEVSLNLVDGSLRCVMGEIAQLNPGAVRVQVGVVTVGVDASSAPRTDASAALEGGTTAVTVDRGSVVVFLPSGQRQAVAAGQGLYLARDGTVVRDTTAKIIQHFDTLLPGDQKQLHALENVGQNIAVTVIMLSNPAMAQQLLALLDRLPPPGQVAQGVPPPAISMANTPPTGAGGGGLPCGASCN